MQQNDRQHKVDMRWWNWALPCNGLANKQCMLWNLGCLDGDLAHTWRTEMCLVCLQRILHCMQCTDCCLLQTGIYHLGTGHRSPALSRMQFDPVRKKYNDERHFG
mmetsp:Transcript_94276/g.172799  ORF Transcript_94276/g.172799 Transcript_94276/m.172799 type:complete len:105 (+) Transcript_94276:188-502(+)